MSEWISVRERLPVNEGRYLTTINFYGFTSVQIRYYTNDLSNDGQYIELKHMHGWYYDDSEWGRIPDDNIVAWQELPEAYKNNEE